jgi:hypothetical protein
VDAPGPSHGARARSRVVQPDISVDGIDASANGHGSRSIVERGLGMVEVGGRGTKVEVGKRRERDLDLDAELLQIEFAYVALLSSVVCSVQNQVASGSLRAVQRPSQRELCLPQMMLPNRHPACILHASVRQPSLLYLISTLSSTP